VAKCELINLPGEGSFAVVTDAAGEAAENPPAAQANTRSVSLGRTAVSGLRQPIVAILLLIALFTTVSGKPLDGFLMLAVATLLTLDAARSLRQGDAGNPGTSSAVRPTASAPGDQPRRGLRRLLARAAWLVAGALFCAIAGSFSRYSWPATGSVIALGCLMIAIGWQGSLSNPPPLRGKPLRRAWLWAVVLVSGGLLELGSLLQQPHLTTDSYAHPTISALTDPLLASHPGRSAVLGGWLLTGWFLVSR
jgi:hypothetical protein